MKNEEPVRGPNGTRRVLWLLLVVIVVALGGMIGLLMYKKNRKPPAEVTEEAVPVLVKAITAQPVADAMTLPGRVMPARTVRFGVEKPGMVVEVLADKGQAVKAGDVLLRLDQRQWTNALKHADVQWREAEREVVRLEELRKRGAISDSDYDRAVAARDMARIAVDAANVSLSQCVLRSTVNGVVEERFVEPGEQVPEGFHAFRVVETDSVKVRVDVPERDVAVVRVGQVLSFRVPGQSGREYTGTVSFVSAEGSAWNNAFAVELTVPNAAGELRPGMLAELVLVRRAIPDAVVVPLGAVIPRKGRYVVFKAVGDRGVEQSVVLETVLDAEAVIGKGLKTGDEVIVEGHRLLSDGRLIRRVAPLAGAEQP
jgi:membrane fusion protein (multidrug efflux system)